nr:30S ribosomal protein S2 [Nanoarchaeum sp.]
MSDEQFLMPLEEYLKAGLHIGTKFRNKYMAKFIYKVRPDGLSVLNIEQINNRLDMAANIMSKFDPKDIIVVCRRENGWKAVKVFSEVTGIRPFIGRYPPGILTNADLENFMEAKLIIVTDPWPDKNAVLDAAKLGIPVIALCDTNNDSRNLDLIIPCNNKGKKSLAIIFMVLAKEYMKRRGITKSDSDFKLTVDDFTAE